MPASFPAGTPTPLAPEALDDVTGGTSFASHVLYVEGQSFHGSNGNENVASGSKADQLDGRGGNDVLDGRDGNDSLWGGNGQDTLYGGTGADLLRGEDGNDVLVGGEGRDTLFGGKGHDTFHDGEGNDVMVGGWGSDTFVFDANGPGGVDQVSGHNKNTAVGEWLSRGDDDTIVIRNLDWSQVRIEFSSGGFAGEVGADGLRELKTNSSGVIIFGDHRVEFRGIEGIRVG